AVDSEILTRNRYNNVKIKQDDSKLENFLTPEELHHFLKCAKNQGNITSYTLMFLLSYTGLRTGEAFGLMWSDIDFKAHTLTVNRIRDRYGVRTPKTSNSCRTIDIDSLLIKQLKIYRSWCSEVKLKYGKILDKENDFIFISQRGADPLSNMAVKYMLNLLIEQYDIKKITPHGLRHTHATVLISEGFPVHTIADRLGNTPQMIYNVYGHSYKELEQNAVKRFSNVVGFNG